MCFSCTGFNLAFSIYIYLKGGSRLEIERLHNLISVSLNDSLAMP